mmetsp:Transcript_20191/g.41930  ORF Transcript_20191/g.41930 Transcript_20191/m.41930 type:complete len:233 (-) Transcript_20191:250-948(-)
MGTHHGQLVVDSTVGVAEMGRVDAPPEAPPGRRCRFSEGVAHQGSIGDLREFVRDHDVPVVLAVAHVFVNVVRDEVDVEPQAQRHDAGEFFLGKDFSGRVVRRVQHENLGIAQGLFQFLLVVGPGGVRFAAAVVFPLRWPQGHKHRFEVEELALGRIQFVKGLEYHALVPRPSDGSKGGSERLGSSECHRDVIDPDTAVAVKSFVILGNRCTEVASSTGRRILIELIASSSR